MNTSSASTDDTLFAVKRLTTRNFQTAVRPPSTASVAP